MRLLVSWITTLLFLPFFAGILLLFHPLFLIAHWISPKAFLFLYKVFNLSILTALRITGMKFEITLKAPLPTCGPVILVSNHQSMFDMPPIIWTTRHLEPKFIAKRELAKGYPSISLCLRHTGSVLIDRSDPKSAYPLIEEFAQRLERSGLTLCIFPEGTRARDGELKPFRAGGLGTLMKHAPSAIIVPIAIDNSWKIVQHKLFPIPWGLTVRLTFLPPRKLTGLTPEQAAQSLHDEIEAALDS